jgi:transposase-like protein
MVDSDVASVGKLLVIRGSELEATILPQEKFQEFLLEHSSNTVLSRVNISRYMLLKVLTLVRMVMVQDVPAVFEGTGEVDETYLGGQWKNERHAVKCRHGQSKRGRGTTKQPVFGILCRSGKVWAELIDGVEAKQLQPKILKQVKKGSIVCSDTWRGYTGIAAKGGIRKKHPLYTSENTYGGIITEP